VEHGGFNNQFSHQAGVADRHLEGDVASVAVAEEVRLPDVEVPEQPGGVVRGLLEGERPIDNVGGAPVSLLLESDDLPGLCKGRQNLSERGFDRRAAAVQKDQGRNLAVGAAVYLVIHLEPVHRRVAAPHGRCMEICRRCATQAENHDGVQGTHGGTSFPDDVSIHCKNLHDFRIFTDSCSANAYIC
jgi:hypothetical protein